MDLRVLQDNYIRKAREVTEERIKPGSLILTTLSTDDGLILNDRKSKLKRLIIIGSDKQREVCYGSILVNTDMNPKASYSEEYLSVQYILKAENYPDFLKYDSYVDCGTLFSIPTSKIYSGEFFGYLTENDMKGVFNILETTELFSTKEKKRYGIKRR